MLKELKFDLKNWKKAHCNRGMSEIKETKDEIQKLEEEWAADLSNGRLRKEIILKKEELWKSYKVEERSWHQKSRFQWLHEGDRNSKFYHLVAADRYRSNSLECIDVGDSVLTDPVENMVNVPRKNQIARIVVTWSPPPLGSLKFNVDGASSGSSGMAGIGESDCSNAVKWVNALIACPWGLNRFIIEIRAITRRLASWHLSHVFRETNIEADELAKSGIDRPSDLIEFCQG
ncbi:hypothetical protein COLO4_32459 [Corchorus olitorius]|uniref:RNase H type-1 domain-containing protein n=1 Tax=Corchorus olitorius TaxID=93759 RepID=A0A1R3GZA4_9ROSI|nr:hypothetical protein COLO4_32459 [Corchorus olitorius]